MYEFVYVFLFLYTQHAAQRGEAGSRRGRHRDVYEDIQMFTCTFAYRCTCKCTHMYVCVYVTMCMYMYVCSTLGSVAKPWMRQE